VAAAHPVVGDVRGRGAMMAVELCRPGTTEPDPATTAAVSAYCHQRGVVTLTCGTWGNVLRLLPPLAISDELLGEGLDVLAEAFASVAGEAGSEVGSEAGSEAGDGATRGG
jgi:4-aminobutyrate aminotransferase/(S)-3-amino-2-methylpropionate transaminase